MRLTLCAVWIASALASAGLAAQIVDGHVVNAVTGADIPGVKVVVFPMPGGPADGQSATTDSQGRFRIDGLESGAYSAIYRAPGFRPIPDPGDMPARFSVAAGAEPVRLEIKMQPLGKLSGRVLDGTGKPVPGASLWLVDEERWCMPPQCSPRTSVGKADEKGTYTVADLVPGSWLLAAAAPPPWDPPESSGTRLGWAQTFYPGVTDPQAAEAIAVGPGTELWNLDIKLGSSPVHNIRGKVLDESGKPVSKAAVELGKGFGPSLKQETRSDGTFEFTAVVDDEWRLAAAADQGGVKLWGAELVEIKRHDLENVELRLNPPFAIHGKIVVESAQGAPAPELPQIDLVLISTTRLPSDAGVSAEPVVISNNGNLSARREIYPGPYQIETLTEAPAPFYLDSIRLGSQEVLGPVSILSGVQPLTVTYKVGGGTVRGAVEGCGTAHVLLIPKDPQRRRHAFIYFTACGPNGRFEFTAVRPGEYYGFAIGGQPWAGTLQDGSLLKQASSVTVEANETTAADIRLVVR